MYPQFFFRTGLRILFEGAAEELGLIPLEDTTQTVVVTGIGSTLAFGIPLITLEILPTGIASTLAFGTPTVTPGDVDIAPTGIPSTLAFGTPTVTPGDVDIAPTGIASTLQFGIPVVTAGDVDIAPTGIASTLVFGTPAVTPGDVDILPLGISSTLQFGVPDIIVIGGEQTIFPVGIASTVMFGIPGIFAEQTIFPTGIASTLQFGVPSVFVSINPQGIKSTLKFGIPSVFYIPKPDEVPREVVEIEFNEDILKLIIKEVYPGEENFDELQKVANHVRIGIPENTSLNQIGVIREGFVKDGTIRYSLKETGSGIFLGLFKNVNGVSKQISPTLPNEIKLLEGDKTIEIEPPAGWEFVTDEDVQSRYNIGSSPRWIAAAIRYRGI